MYCFQKLSVSGLTDELLTSVTVLNSLLSSSSNDSVLKEVVEGTGRLRIKRFFRRFEGVKLEVGISVVVLENPKRLGDAVDVAE